MEKINLWRDTEIGLKSRFKDEALPAALNREDISTLLVEEKIRRGDVSQQIRLRYYPSINVDRERLIAGKIDKDLDEARDRLISLGFRNNPTSYVEVTEENGPDDGSYSRNIVSEAGGRLDIPRLSQRPSFYRRVKEQVHVCVFEVSDGTEYLAHREKSAWLQPIRHVVVGDPSARRGVRDFRNMWYDEFGEELPGKDLIHWDVTN